MKGGGGSLAAPGGFGWGTWSQRSTNTDLNTLKAVGSYAVNLPVNGPAETGWWHFWVPASFSDGQGYGVQFAKKIASTDDLLYYRAFNNGMYKAWALLPSGFDGVPVNGKAAPGGFGLGVLRGKILPNNTDLNTIIYPGFYAATASSGAATMLNCPTTNAFSLTVEASAGCIQTIKEYMINSVTKTFQRKLYFSDKQYWGPWVELPSGITDAVNVTNSSIAASSTAVKAAYDTAVTAQTTANNAGANSNYANSAGSATRLLPGTPYTDLTFLPPTDGGGGWFSQGLQASLTPVNGGQALLKWNANGNNGISGRNSYLYITQIDKTYEKYLGTSDPRERWTTIYIVNAPSVSSDIRQKTLVNEDGSIDEKLIKAWSEVNFVQYSRVEGKRVHIGCIAQRVKSAFEKYGIDPFEYSLLCHDKWEAKEEQIETDTFEVSPAVYEEQTTEIAPAYTDENGTEWPAQTITESVMVKEAVTEEHTRVLQPAREAGDMYSLRYEECLCLEAAYQRWRADKVQTELEAIKQRLNLLELK